MKKQLPFISYEKTDNIKCESGYDEQGFYNSSKPNNKICIKYLNNKDIVKEDNKNIKIRSDVSCIGIEKCLPCDSKSDDLEIKYRYITPKKYSLSNVEPVCVEKTQWIWPFNYLAKKDLKKKQKEIIRQKIQEEEKKQELFSNNLSKINKQPPPIPIAPSYLPEQDNVMGIVTRDILSKPPAPKRFPSPSSILPNISRKPKTQPIIRFSYNKIHTRKNKRMSGKRMSSKIHTRKNKRISGKRISGKRMSSKIHTRKNKRMSSKRISGKRISGKRMSSNIHTRKSKRISGNIHTRKSKRINGKRLIITF